VNVYEGIIYSGFLLFLDLDHLDAVVGAAREANLVRQSHLVTLRAGDEMQRLQGVVAAPTIASPFGDFAFW
jgi:hypothetical protein